MVRDINDSVCKYMPLSTDGGFFVANYAEIWLIVHRGL